MTVKLLAEQPLEFLSLKEASQARLSLFMSKCHIDVYLMSRLNYFVPVLYVYYNFLLSVKTVTLIFISGRGSVISSAKQGKSGSIHNLMNN